MKPLKLGLIAPSEPARELIEALLQPTAGFELSGYVGETTPGWFAESVPDLRRFADALDLLHESRPDVLLLLGAVSETKSLVQSLLSAGTPVVVFPLAEYGSTLAYELSVAALDDQAPLICCWPHRHSSAVIHLSRNWRNVRLAEIDHQLPATTSGVLDWSAVEQALLVTGDLVSFWFGEPRRITTVTAGSDPAQPALVTVTLHGDDVAPDVMLTFRPGDPRCRTLKVTHALGTDSFDLTATPPDPASLESSWRSRTTEPGSPGHWLQLMRAFDLLDAARRSLRRSRTVEINGNEASERNQFKTQMTAIGCGVLGFTLCAVLIMLLAGALLDPRDTQQRESEALGLVVFERDFQADSHQLLPPASEKLRTIAEAWTSSTAAILIESHADESLNRLRIEAVSTVLEEAGVHAPQSRLMVRTLSGSLFRTVLRFGWILSFTPLAIYLLLQSLIVITARNE